MHRRRRPTVPVLGAPSPPEATVEHPSPERLLLDSLMREVSETRREIELDLTLAVGATEGDHTDLADALVDDSRLRVATLHGRLLDHLAELHTVGAADHLDPDDLGLPAPRSAPLPSRGAPVVVGSGWRRALLPLAPLLATAAAVATLLSGGPSPVTNPATLPLSQQSVLQADFDSLGEVVLRRSDEDSVLAAVRRLHDAVRPLVIVAGTDPVSAATARTVLLRQRELVRREQPAGARTALTETDAILADLRRVGVALPPLQDLLSDTPRVLATVVARAPQTPSAQRPTARPPAPPTPAVVAPAPSKPQDAAATAPAVAADPTAAPTPAPAATPAAPAQPMVAPSPAAAPSPSGLTPSPQPASVGGDSAPPTADPTAEPRERLSGT